MGRAAVDAGIKGLGDVAPHVEAAAIEISKKFGITNIGGRASSGHISGSDHYTGHAIDIMVYTNKPLGDAVKDYVFANWERLGVKYVIWYRTYYPSPSKSEPYTGPSPHTDHVHVSFQKSAGSGDVVDTGGASGTDLSTREGCIAFVTKLFPV